jgi:3D (Asp-Asp-Asp) domain-containing protein
MAKTILTARDVQFQLNKFGYYEGIINGDLLGDTRDSIRRFQLDNSLSADGLYGAKSEAKLLDMMSRMDKYAPKELKNMRRWQLTYYWIANESIWDTLNPFGPKVPLKDNKGNLIAMVSARFFSDVALQGSGVLKDGRLVNVASNPDYVPCDAKVFQPCFDFAVKNGWIENKAGYAGIRTDGSKATAARAFTVVPEAQKGVGYGMVAGRAHVPFKTLATDVGAPSIKRSDPTFMGKGGVIPRGSKVFILEFAGQKLPDGSIHDGWCTAVDSGGGIFKNHIDTFTGQQGLAKKFNIPSLAHIWYVTTDGQTIEQRLPYHYEDNRTW